MFWAYALKLYDPLKFKNLFVFFLSCLYFFLIGKLSFFWGALIVSMFDSCCDIVAQLLFQPLALLLTIHSSCVGAQLLLQHYF